MGVPVDTLNGLLGDKEALRKVLLRHVIPGRKLEGKDVPNGSTNLKTASGEEVKADRGKFVQVSSSNKKAFVVKFDFVGSNWVQVRSKLGPTGSTMPLTRSSSFVGSKLGPTWPTRSSSPTPTCLARNLL